MKDKSLLKTLIICISFMIGCFLISYSIYESNRYYVQCFGSTVIIVDKYSKDTWNYNFEKKQYEKLN